LSALNSFLTPPKFLETERLFLRVPTLNDVEFVHSYAIDNDVARYMTWRPHTHISQSKHYLEQCIKDWKEGTNHPWFIDEKELGVTIGVVGVRINGHSVQVGYVLSKPYWRNGYMTEAVIAVRDWALAQPEVYRFGATGDKDNIGSRRVLEKAGLEFEGILRRWEVRPNISSEPRDSFFYSIIK